MEEPMIRVEHVKKKFRLPHDKATTIKGMLVNKLQGRRGFEIQKALNDVSFEVQQGDFFGIVGRNGSGKSTLLKLLAGVYVPNEGTVGVRGKLVPFIELGVGFNVELTGRENVYLNGALLGFSEAQVKAMYDEIVEFAELERFMDQKLKNYSSGMQVRLAFSIAIRAQSDILLLDEVLAVGDAAFQQKCYNYFEKLKREKRTVVFVSHDMGAVRRFCNKALYLQNGEVVMEGSPSDIADLYIENNIDISEENQKSGTIVALPDEYSISGRITKQSEISLELKVTYEVKRGDAAYIGIAVVKDGFPIAELTTPPDEPLSGKGSVTYILDKTIFNQGIYTIGNPSLFRANNRELVAINKKKLSFVIKGSDITRGGAIKLAPNWEYDKD